MYKLNMLQVSVIYALYNRYLYKYSVYNGYI